MAAIFLLAAVVHLVVTADPDAPATRESRLDAPLARHMSETDAVLWSVVIVATVADVVTTISGLSLGLGEGNVVVREMIATLGLAGFWLVKFCALAALATGWALLPERKATAFLAVFALVTMGVVLSNAVTLLAV